MRNKNGGKTSSIVKDRYNAKTYDRLYVRVKKGNKSIIEDYAARSGESVNSYIMNAVYKRMKKEGFIPGQTGPAGPQELEE